MGRNPDDTESDDSEGASKLDHTEASRPAGPAASPRGADKERESGDGSAKRGRPGGTIGDPSTSQSFAEVWLAHYTF